MPRARSPRVGSFGSRRASASRPLPRVLPAPRADGKRGFLPLAPHNSQIRRTRDTCGVVQSDGSCATSTCRGARMRRVGSRWSYASHYEGQRSDDVCLPLPSVPEHESTTITGPVLQAHAPPTLPAGPDEHHVRRPLRRHDDRHARILSLFFIMAALSNFFRAHATDPYPSHFTRPVFAGCCKVGEVQLPMADPLQMLPLCIVKYYWY